MRKVCVLGMGYIGLPTAAMFASHGFIVTGVDICDHIVSTINNGGLHIQEPGLKPLVHAALMSGSLQVRAQPEPADAFIIAVPTPFMKDIEDQSAENGRDPGYKRADMRAVISAAESIAPHLRPGNIVILESTSPPRTTADLVKPILEGSGLFAGEDFFLAYSPERVLPGRILSELVENARVIGGIDRASAEVGSRLYSAFVKGEIVLTDATTAEMVKLMENTYRDANIAIANEFSRLADRFEIDVWEAIRIANRHPRVNILNPGPGVGGHCISVDPWFLVEAAPDITPLIRAGRQVNDAQPSYVVDFIRRCAGYLDGKRIVVLGLAYKADVDDLRESPSVEVARLMADAGAIVTAYEPLKPQAKFAGFQTAPNLEAALEWAEVLALLVGHQQFRELTPEVVAGITPARTLVDAVNGWDSALWQAAGFQYFRLGSSIQALELQPTGVGL